MTSPARKTFSGLDTRKPAISPPYREADERLQRVTRAETREEVLAVVLSQPHRAGMDNPGRHWAIGRLILDGVVACHGISSGKLIRAAELYDRAWADMRWILDSRRPWINSTAMLRDPPTKEDRIDKEKAWADIQRALRDAGPVALYAAQRIIIDRPSDEQIPWLLVEHLPDALRALVKHFDLDK